MKCGRPKGDNIVGVNLGTPPRCVDGVIDVRLAVVVAVLAVTAACRSQEAPVMAALPNNQLRSVADFKTITDTKQRSRALFLEASRVLLHPRCANCHPDGDVPLQGMQMIPHQPPVTRGPESTAWSGWSARAAIRIATWCRPACPAPLSGTSRRARWRGLERVRVRSASR